MILPTDMIDHIAKFCTIKSFMEVNKHSKHMCEERASSVITDSIRKWIVKKNTTCHGYMVDTDIPIICLKMVRTCFNEFDRPDIKILLEVEFTGLTFNTIVALLGGGLYGGEDVDEYDEEMCRKLTRHIIKDCFDYREFDMEYLDSLITMIDPDYRSTEDGILYSTRYINEITISFTRAIFDVCTMVSCWKCLNICDAIERITRDPHHMILLDV